jgi:hypothetical protein
VSSKDYQYRAELCRQLAARFTLPELKTIFEQLAAAHRDEAVTADLSEWHWSDNEPSA